MFFCNYKFISISSSSSLSFVIGNICIHCIINWLFFWLLFSYALHIFPIAEIAFSVAVGHKNGCSPHNNINIVKPNEYISTFGVIIDFIRLYGDHSGAEYPNVPRHSLNTVGLLLLNFVLAVLLLPVS